MTPLLLSGISSQNIETVLRYGLMQFAERSSEREHPPLTGMGIVLFFPPARARQRASSGGPWADLRKGSAPVAERNEPTPPDYLPGNLRR